MFHRSSIKLAGLYLLIMMTISMFFSVSVYQLSVQEFNRGLRHQPASFDQYDGPDFSDEQRGVLRESGEQQFKEAKERILSRLILVNVIILIGGGMICYYLALNTLRPIEDAHAAQKRFTADASHELRTPITVMRTENEVTLMNPNLTLAAAKQQITSNVEELEKLSALTDGLLRLATIEDAGLPAVAIKLDDLINKAIERVTPLAKQKHIVIKSSNKSNAAVLGDEGSLVEALVILLDNAIKYSPLRKAVTVATLHNNRSAVIKISDQGSGIAAADMPFIFDRFYRADSSRSKQKTEGYGLGLAISKQIITLHGGSISAESKNGNGATFTVSLPKN